MSELRSSSFEQGRDLAKTLSQGALTPEEIRSVPAQLLYVALLSAGEELLPDLVPYVTAEQYRLLLDFDFWEKDTFLTQRFIDWLRAIHAEDSLELFEQFLSVVPLDVLELVTQGFVEVLVNEERSDVPPEVGWFTPDSGQMWLRFLVEDEYELRILGQFYAYLFQRSPELFYQLMLNLNATTSIELEETSFEDRQRRLMDAGLPDIDSQLELQSPLPWARAVRRLQGEVHGYEGVMVEPSSSQATEDSHVVVAHRGELQPFDGFLAALSTESLAIPVEDLLAELARILNAGLVVYRTALDDGQEVQRFQEQVRGLINIALERIATEQQGAAPYSARHIYQCLSLQGLYRLGLAELSTLRSAILAAEPLLDEPELDAVQAAFAHPIPLYPTHWVEGESAGQYVESSAKPFEHLAEIDALLMHLLEFLSSRRDATSA